MRPAAVWPPIVENDDDIAPLERFVDADAYCLYDVSRLISHRDRRHPTGVDRIDLEYLMRLHARMGVRCVGVTRLGGDFVLLTDDETAALVAGLSERWLKGRPGRDPRLTAFERRGLAPGRWRYDRAKGFRARRAEDIAWSLASAGITAASLWRRVRRRRADARQLARMRRKGVVYLTCSHFGLARVRGAAERLVRLSGAKTLAYVHDLIPIHYPEYQRAGAGAGLAAFLRRLADLDAVFVCNSITTRGDLRAWLAAEGRANPAHVAYPPLDYLRDIPKATDPKRPIAEPYFICVGTIEPRKNHALLLDVWAAFARELGPATPKLVVAGVYGWQFDEIKRRLEGDAALKPHVRHVRDADDARLWSLIRHAEALLFPSHCEGLGLPLVEAQHMGVPCIVSDIPAFRELAAGETVLIDVADRDRWRAAVLAAVRTAAAAQ